MTSRALFFAIAVYVPHLVEEHLARMHDDPILAPALAPLATMSPGAAGYAVFQIMLVVTLATASLVALGGRARAAVIVVLGLALVAEAHHLVRAAATLDYNAGLWTAAPMPVLGAIVLAALARGARPTASPVA